MALPAAYNPISLGQIQTEFCGSNPIALAGEYYRGGAYVTQNNTNVPTSGTISLSNFYGATRAYIETISFTRNANNQNSFYLNSPGLPTIEITTTVNGGGSVDTYYIPANTTFSVTSNPNTSIRLTDNTMELDDNINNDPDRDYNDLTITPNIGYFSESNGNFYYELNRACDENEFIVRISSNTTNVNVLTLFETTYPGSWTQDVPKRLIVESGVTVGATNTSDYALNIPSGLVSTLRIDNNNGSIQGAGGLGGGENTHIFMRLYSGLLGGVHFYTSNAAAEFIVGNGYGVEYREYFATYASNVSGTTPLYRSYNENGTGAHLFTINLQEYQNTINAGWRDEGIVGYVLSSNVSGTIPIYRWYNKLSGDFLLSNTSDERPSDYKDEGIAFYTIDINNPSFYVRNGRHGGNAILANSPVSINNSGSIYAGGGGGGRGGLGGVGDGITYTGGSYQGTPGGAGGIGGRGIGYNQALSSGNSGQPGSDTENRGTGGAGGLGGTGGNWGTSGDVGEIGANGTVSNGLSGYLAGSSGNYIVGNSNVTWITTGTRAGGVA